MERTQRHGQLMQKPKAKNSSFKHRIRDILLIRQTTSMPKSSSKYKT